MIWFYLPVNKQLLTNLTTNIMQNSRILQKIKPSLCSLALGLALVTTPIFIHSSFAQDNTLRKTAPSKSSSSNKPNTTNLEGEIVLEQDGPKANLSAILLSEALVFVENVSQTVDRASSGNRGEISPPSQKALDYINAIYLYCTSRMGVCPQVLDGLLEIDIYNSKLNGKVDCPVLKKFWQAWIKNGFEARQSFLVQTSNIQRTSDFTRKERPRYIECQETVREQLDDSPAADNFWARYSAGGIGQSRITKLQEIINYVKSNVGDIYPKIGMAMQTAK